MVEYESEKRKTSKVDIDSNEWTPSNYREIRHQCGIPTKLTKYPRHVA